MTIQHFPAPPGIKAPPLSFAARTGDLLFISGIPGFDPQGNLPGTFEGVAQGEAGRPLGRELEFA